MRTLNQWIGAAVLASLAFLHSFSFSDIEKDRALLELDGVALDRMPFSLEGLSLEYIQGDIFDTCVVNGEQFALIDDRALQLLVNEGNMVLNLPLHHLIILDHVIADTLVLEGKSATIINPLTISGDLTINVPKDRGNIIIYGAEITGGNADSQTKMSGKRLYASRSRISHHLVEKNGKSKKIKVDYLEIINHLFHEGISNQSSEIIAYALLQTGHQTLLSKADEINRSAILILWNVP